MNTRLQCWMVEGCSRMADTYLFDPSGKIIGLYCREHAEAAVVEYRKKLGEIWSTEKDEQDLRQTGKCPDCKVRRLFNHPQRLKDAFCPECGRKLVKTNCMLHWPLKEGAIDRWAASRLRKNPLPAGGEVK